MRLGIKRPVIATCLLVAVAVTGAACGGSTTSNQSASPSASASSAKLSAAQACAQVNQAISGMSEDQFMANLSQVGATLSALAANTADPTLAAAINSVATEIKAGASAGLATASANAAEQLASVTRWYDAIMAIEAQCGTASPSSSASR